MSETPQQQLAIEALVRGRCHELGLRPVELVRRCGYQNVSKGLRRLEQLRAGDFARTAGLVRALPTALEVPVDAVREAVEKTERYLHESAEAAWRAASRDELIREIRSRNQLRAAVGLPLVSVEAEIEKLHRWEIREAYRRWSYTHPLRPKIEEEILEAERKSRGDPTWLPRYYLNGGLAFSIQVEKRMRQLWEKKRHG